MNVWRRSSWPSLAGGPRSRGRHCNHHRRSQRSGRSTELGRAVVEKRGALHLHWAGHAPPTPSPRLRARGEREGAPVE